MITPDPSFEPAMQVSSAPSPSSALDTWLQDSALDAATAQPPGRNATASPASGAVSSGRDNAEGLLSLEVWGKDAAKGQLLTVTLPPDPSMAGAAQLWASHIFAPLV